MVAWPKLSALWRPEPPAGMGRVPSGRVRLAGGRTARVGAFWLDLDPVTNREWHAFVKATGARRPDWASRRGFDDPLQPVVGVTLAEARAYARWRRARLPTGLEWLRAASGDDGRPNPWGEAVAQPGLAWVGRGPAGAPAVVGPGARPGGSGPFGHRDLVGNVWEWCADGVLRGGFWGSAAPSNASCLLEPSHRSSAGYGFRCAR